MPANYADTAALTMVRTAGLEPAPGLATITVRTELAPERDRGGGNSRFARLVP